MNEISEATKMAAKTIYTDNILRETGEGLVERIQQVIDEEINKVKQSHRKQLEDCLGAKWFSSYSEILAEHKEQINEIIKAKDAEIERFEEAMGKVLIHTINSPCTKRQLLIGLLDSIKRITKEALSGEEEK